MNSRSRAAAKLRQIEYNMTMEWIKELSDRLLIWFLRVTSRFGSELTRHGESEQALWREQRLRNLHGLALRSRQRHGDKS